jgi:hypothetical protein
LGVLADHGSPIELAVLLVEIQYLGFVEMVEKISSNL